MKESDYNPTLENVLPEYKWIDKPDCYLDNFGKASDVSDRAYNLGARAALPGLSMCPWCNAQMDMGLHPENKNKNRINWTRIAVCLNNPKHMVEWLPWGG